MLKDGVCVIFGSEQVMNMVRPLSHGLGGTLETIVYSPLHIYTTALKDKHKLGVDNATL